MDSQDTQDTQDTESGVLELGIMNGVGYREGQRPFRDVLIVDLDETLFNTKHRQHVLTDNSSKPDWALFNSLHVHDTVYPIAAKFIEKLQVEFKKQTGTALFVHILTGRSAVELHTTEQKLEQEGIKYNLLMMRPEGNFLPAKSFKKYMLKRHSIFPHNVLAIIDEDPGVLALMDKDGYRTIDAHDVNAGRYGYFKLTRGDGSRPAMFKL
jgi:FMN phosphatase YigB (HAD superfamily)